MNTNKPNPAPRWLVTGAIAFGCIAVTILVALYAWQIDVRDSKVKDAERHATAVLHLQNASTDTDLAGELLAAYASQGDQALVPQIESHAAIALGSLTAAVSASNSDAISQIAVEGTALAEGAGQIMALRENGDIEGALVTIEELRPSFNAFELALEDGINLELEQAAALQTDADNADTTASWLLITAMAVGVSTVVGALFLIGRSLLKRQAPETPTPA